MDIFESQIFLFDYSYRDLTHASGSSLPRHLGDVASSGGPREADKQRSYYYSYCDMRSLSLHITHLFQELDKVMLLPSRRRDDMVTVTPASKSVASTFAAITLDHMNFEGHVKLSGSVALWSPKCQYLGKVIDFIDGILLEKPFTNLVTQVSVSGNCRRNQKVHGLANMSTTYATNLAIITGHYCGAREIVGASGHSEPDNLFDSIIDGFGQHIKVRNFKNDPMRDVQ